MTTRLEMNCAMLPPGANHCKRDRVGQNALDAAEGRVQRCEVPISPRPKRGKNFHLHFSVIRIGSHGTLIHGALRCKFQM